jgi:hypothetical protein
MKTAPSSADVKTGPLTALDPQRQALLLLRTVFTVAPTIFGLDKFTNLLTHWAVASRH